MKLVGIVSKKIEMENRKESLKESVYLRRELEGKKRDNGGKK